LFFHKKIKKISKNPLKAIDKTQKKYYNIMSCVFGFDLSRNFIRRQTRQPLICLKIKNINQEELLQ